MMSDRIDWALLVEYSSGFEADQAIVQLEQAEIPVFTQGPEIGIFGPGFSGPTSRGVRLYVPEPLLEDARSILEPA
jgi:hypothetical protein